MKKYFPLVLTLVFVFAFSFGLTLEVTAFSKAQDPGPVICCTYTTWCGTTGYGSWVWETCYDPQGKPYPCKVCRFLLPNNPNYNPGCIYAPAGGCNID